jgi:hypothetical protein
MYIIRINDTQRDVTRYKKRIIKKQDGCKSTIFGSDEGPKPGCCEHGNEPLISIK